MTETKDSTTTSTEITRSGEVASPTPPTVRPATVRPATVRPATPPGRRDAAWRIVAAREMSVKIKDRGFLISTLVTLALILGALGAQVLIGSSAEKISVGTVGADGAAVVKQALALADAAGEELEITAKPLAGDVQVRAAVLAGDVDAGLAGGVGGWTLVGKTDRNSTAAIWIGAAVQQSALELNATAAGTTPAALAEGGSLNYALLSPDETPEMVVKVVTYVFGFLFYLAAVLLGVTLATSIVEEKQSRIVEIIASSIRLRDLLVGKVLGNTLMAMAQMTVFAVSGVIGLIAFGKKDMLEQVTSGLGWFFLFYAVGIAVLACVFAAAGAMATRSEDIQSTTTPISAVVAVVFIAGVSASGTLLTVLSFLPLTSTITMPGRIVAGDTSWWEPVVALLISLVAAVVVIQISERIYRRALMQTGGKLSLRQALKLTD